MCSCAHGIHIDISVVCTVLKLYIVVIFFGVASVTEHTSNMGVVNSLTYGWNNILTALFAKDNITVVRTVGYSEGWINGVETCINRTRNTCECAERFTLKICSKKHLTVIVAVVHVKCCIHKTDKTSDAGAVNILGNIDCTIVVRLLHLAHRVLECCCQTSDTENVIVENILGHLTDDSDIYAVGVIGELATVNLSYKTSDCYATWSRLMVDERSRSRAIYHCTIVDDVCKSSGVQITAYLNSYIGQGQIVNLCLANAKEWRRKTIDCVVVTVEGVDEAIDRSPLNTCHIDSCHQLRLGTRCEYRGNLCELLQVGHGVDLEYTLLVSLGAVLCECKLAKLTNCSGLEALLSVSREFYNHNLVVGCYELCCNSSIRSCRNGYIDRCSLVSLQSKTLAKRHLDLVCGRALLYNECACRAAYIESTCQTVGVRSNNHL